MLHAATARARAEHCLQAAQAHRAHHRWAEAVQALNSAAEAAAADAEASALVGDFCSRIEEIARAFSAYDRAVALRPDRPVHWFNRAATRRHLGDLAGAEADYDQCLALDPTDAQACLNRSDLRVQTPTHNHVAQLEQHLATGSAGWQREVQVRYALAKEYEDLGQHADSWAQLVAGAGLRRRHLAYDPRTDLETVDWLIGAFPAAMPLAAGDSTQEPIFILGMPRTGSTVVDRMIGNHSQVQSAGELLHFGNAVIRAARARLQDSAPGVQAGRRELVFASAGIDLAALGTDYLARTRPQTGRSPRFTDKLPLNYLYCGLIAGALPKAGIVHVTRHPMASCYGAFKVLFDQGYPFSYDLQEIADYYIAYRRLMAHWRATLPGRIIDVAYEDVVANPDGECRRLIHALGLPWEDACVRFDQNPAPATTASASQVRRPLYASAVDQWRQYAEGLAPLRRRLEAAGINCD
jgi:tetratricopeptide (TPR) repeat protein